MTLRPRRPVAALLLAVALIGVPSGALAASGSASASPPAHPPTTRTGWSAATAAAPLAASVSALSFEVGIRQDVDSLNPFVGILSSSKLVWGLTYDTLLGYSQTDYSPVPGLASSWTASADQLTWTYKIRSGVTWSDGVPLTAADAAYTFNRIMRGSVEQSNYGSYVANITNATAPDAGTLILTVSKPTPIMLRLAVPILPEHIWSKIDENALPSATNANLVGSGPFILQQHVTGQSIRFAANPSYWGGAPKIKELVFRVFPDEAAMVAALKSGQIDFVDRLGTASYDALKSDAAIVRVAAEYGGFDELAMNTGAATNTGVPIGNGNVALKDKRVRQAISYAVDTNALVSDVLGGYGQPGTSIIPPVYAELHFDPAGSTRAFSLDMANQILDNAGYTKVSGGIRVLPGTSQPLTLRLFGRSNSPTSIESVHRIAGWLAKIGIDVQTQVVSQESLAQMIGSGTFDMFEWGWVVEPDPNQQLSTFLCSSRSTKAGATITAGLSDSFYCNPSYDALYAQQSTATDPTTRNAIVKQMQQILYEDAPYVVTYYYQNLQAYRGDRFTNFQPQPDPNGSLLFQYGTFSYRSIVPVEDPGGTASTGMGLRLWLTIAGLAIAVAVSVALVVRRSGRPAHKRR